MAGDLEPKRVARDPGDDYIVALARTAGTAVILSGDQDLQYLRLTPPVFSPRAFLDVLRGRLYDALAPLATFVALESQSSSK